MKQMLTVISLWVVRILLVFVPQTGYIHPDEFFQSVEVSAADVFNVQVQRTWEFNATFPLRSAVAVHGMASVPMVLLRLLDQWIYSFSSVSVVTAYTVLLAPRLFLTLLSYINDYCVWNLSRKFGFHSELCALIYASSYVTLVFYTRTMSNTLETLLFNVLLIFVTSHLKSSTKAQKPHRKSHSDEDEGNDILGNLQYQTVMSSTGLGIVMACGVFNRPTFLVFAFVPVLFWLINSFSLFTLIARMVYLSVGVFFTSAIIISLDTVYYKDTMIDLEMDVQQCLESSTQVFGCIFEAAKKNFVVTPLNFILYNTNKQNLESHGAHPVFLHLTVNSTILFGPLALLGILLCFKNCLRNPLECFSFRGTTTWPMLWILYFPILVLSAFPHQEPRFLIPLLTPVILLTSQYFTQNFLGSKFLCVIWVIFNLIGLIFFGFFHQGGVVPSLMHMNFKLQSRPKLTTERIFGRNATQNMTHLIFSHCYMPPEHLLMRPVNNDTPEQEGFTDREITRVHDLKGADLEQLESLVNSLKELRKPQEIYLLTPFTRLQRLCERLPLQWVTSVFPHLSMEDPPNVFKLFVEKQGKTLPTQCVQPHRTDSQWNNFLDAFSFVILKIM